MSLLDEFKKFIFKGDVVALSTGVMIGAAFGKIVDAFTNGIVAPILRLFGGSPDVSLGVTIGKFEQPVIKDGKPLMEKLADGTEKAVTQTVDNKIDIGLVINAALAFLITAAIIFFFIVKPSQKLMAAIKKKEAEEPPAPPAQEVLLTEIRDLLKSGK